MFDVKAIREDFPVLSRSVNNNSLVYFDNAATSQTPKQVVDCIANYYYNYNANIHRGVHALSQEATDGYEQARQNVKKHFNAKHAHEIIFTSGTTESINVIAYSFSVFLKKGDVVLISSQEHHSNIVPWQMLCERTGAILKVIPINHDGEIIISKFDKLISKQTKLVCVNHVSNALGTIHPIKHIIEKTHEFEGAVLIDGAQSASHMKIDLQNLDVDFFATSAHKMCGPTGVGLLYGKEDWLNKLPPYKGGGEMISEVTFEKTTYADLPHKFEAGTPNISGVIAFSAAIDYINRIGLDNIAKHEEKLLEYATEKLLEIEGIKIYGTSKDKISVISFNLEGAHPYDVGFILNKLGIAVRTGHHCTQPIMQFYNIPGTVRASFAFYNTLEEIDRFIEAVRKAKTMLIM